VSVGYVSDGLGGEAWGGIEVMGVKAAAEGDIPDEEAAVGAASQCLVGLGNRAGATVSTAGVEVTPLSVAVMFGRACGGDGHRVQRSFRTQEFRELQKVKPGGRLCR